MININDSCPYCEKNFADTDDVVFCPECGTPHHRACWLENGKCANLEKHSEGFVFVSENPVKEQETKKPENNDEPIVCPRCGTESSAKTLVCPGCGMRFGSIPNMGSFAYNTDFFMKGITEDPETDLGGFTVKEASMYVQSKSSVYVKKFVKQKNSNKKVGWNWAAFLFSPLWFFYRKLYKVGFCFAALTVAILLFVAVPMGKDYSVYESKIEEYVEIDDDTTYEELSKQIFSLSEAQIASITKARWGYLKWFFITLAFPNTAAALFADAIYKSKISKDIKKIKEFSQNEKTFEVLMLRKGGTSMLGLIAGCCIIFSLLSNIMLYL